MTDDVRIVQLTFDLKRHDTPATVAEMLWELCVAFAAPWGATAKHKSIELELELERISKRFV